MLAMQEGRLREGFIDRGTQVVERSQPLSRERSKPQFSAWNRLSAFGCIGVCTIILWYMAAVGARIDSINNGIGKMQSQIGQMSAANASLTTRVDDLTRPTRILNYALNQLHMKYATPVTIVARSK